ncbi:MAG: CU044_5270 family protein [Actinomycetota bacterium]
MRHDVMELLRSADPVDPDRVRGWASGSQGQRVYLGILGQAPEKVPQRVRLRSRRRLALIPAGAAVLALALVIGSTVLPGVRGGASAEAAQVLRRAADVAGARPPVAAEGRYRYTRSESAYLWTSVEDGTSVSALVPEVRERWVASDGSGRIRSETGDPIFLGPRDRARYETCCIRERWGGRTSDKTFGPGGLFYQDVSGLSTDPAELYGQIERRAAKPLGAADDETGVTDEGVPGAVEMFVMVGDLLRETVAPPALRAALYEVAARIPGVELVGGVADPAGRRGVAVAIESDYSGALIREELVFDPNTSELLAERQVLLERVPWLDAEPGAVIGWAAYLQSGTVDSTSVRPS